MSERLRVGVVGARGIGKHHAKWFAREDCDVAAIYGTTQASAEQAAAGLRELFGFEGQALWDWDAFCATDLDAVSVATPAEAHHANVLDLVRAGRHVLCEKPIVWDWDESPERLVAEAMEMVEAAEAAGVVLAVNAQYPAALPVFVELHHRALGTVPEFRRLDYVMETKGEPRSPHGPAEVWVDLGPHPLAFVDAVLPGGAVDWDTLHHRGHGLESVVQFDWVHPTRRVPVTMTLRRVPGATPARQISTETMTVDYLGRNVDGEFMAVLSSGERELLAPDFMRTSVARFVQAVRAGQPEQALVTGRAGLRQLEALVGVWDRCWRGKAATD